MNITKVTFPEGRRAAIASSALWQWDYGQLLQIEGLDLPAAFQAHFCNTGDTETLTCVGTDGCVDIPDDVLRSGERILVYIYLHTGETDGETEYVITILVNPRPAISPVEPTPTQQDAIDQAIEALNAAVTQTGLDAASAARSAEEASDSAAAAGRAQNAAEDARDAARRAQTAAETAQGLAEYAQGKAEDAQESAEREAAAALISAQDAYRDAERAEQAAGTSGYIEIEIDADGHLIYTRTDAVDVDFELVDGHLIMEAI